MNERYAAESSIPTPERPTSVQELISEVTQVLDGSFSSLFVEGELSNLGRPASGHLYFTLKDDRAQIRCVMWRSDAQRLRFRPADGMKVRIRGSLTVYPARGEMQLSARHMEAAGEGELQRALAELKKRLDLEGLFDEGRKRALPRFPTCVGVITSGSGAAVQDIMTVLGRRYPLALAVLCAVTVQGDDASRQIEAALRSFNRLPMGHPQRPDTLILARGGGSLEDLWAFNKERTVRAIHASGIPVVVGVGHETDITLADFVADRRAATPSMAAELAVPDREELRATVARVADRQSGLVARRLSHARALLERASRVRTHGHPRLRLERTQQALDELVLRLQSTIERQLERKRLVLKGRMESWRLRDPLLPLESGFALVTSADGVVTSADAVPRDEPFSLRFRDGRVQARQIRND